MVPIMCVGVVYGDRLKGGRGDVTSCICAVKRAIGLVSTKQG